MGKENLGHEQRTKLIAETLEQVRAIRSTINPSVLEEVESLFKVSEAGAEDSDIKIDRQKNVRFVMDFLNSPAGAHLKEKILP